MVKDLKFQESISSDCFGVVVACLFHPGDLQEPIIENSILPIIRVLGEKATEKYSTWKILSINNIMN